MYNSDNVGHYKPIRTILIFKDFSGEIEFGGVNGARMFKLKGLGRLIWHKMDGKHTINSIVDYLVCKLDLEERETVSKELITLIQTLVKRRVAYANWDPLYKSTLCQELN